MFVRLRLIPQPHKSSYNIEDKKSAMHEWVFIYYFLTTGSCSSLQNKRLTTVEYYDTTKIKDLISFQQLMTLMQINNFVLKILSEIEVVVCGVK